MNSQSPEFLPQPAHAPALAVVICTRCKVILYVTDPMEKFTHYRKLTCPYCRQPHRMDLYFRGERDCFGLVPVRRRSAASSLDEGD